MIDLYRPPNPQFELGDLYFTPGALKVLFSPRKRPSAS
jgi:hypothetical protein